MAKLIITPAVGTEDVINKFTYSINDGNPTNVNLGEDKKGVVNSLTLTDGDTITVTTELKEEYSGYNAPTNVVYEYSIPLPSPSVNSDGSGSCIIMRGSGDTISTAYEVTINKNASFTITQSGYGTDFFNLYDKTDDRGTITCSVVAVSETKRSAPTIETNILLPPRSPQLNVSGTVVTPQFGSDEVEVFLANGWTSIECECIFTDYRGEEISELQGKKFSVMYNVENEAWGVHDIGEDALSPADYYVKGRIKVGDEENPVYTSYSNVTTAITIGE